MLFSGRPFEHGHMPDGRGRRGAAGRGAAHREGKGHAELSQPARTRYMRLTRGEMTGKTVDRRPSGIRTARAGLACAQDRGHAAKREAHRDADKDHPGHRAARRHSKAFLRNEARFGRSILSRAASATVRTQEQGPLRATKETP